MTELVSILQVNCDEKVHRHRYKPTYWEKIILGRTLEKYDFCLICGKERKVKIRKS